MNDETDEPVYSETDVTTVAATISLFRVAREHNATTPPRPQSPLAGRVWDELMALRATATVSRARDAEWRAAVEALREEYQDDHALDALLARMEAK